MSDDLIERLCRCLAIHTIETENTAQMVVGDEPFLQDSIAEARQLIAEAGFDFDTLYPVAERPIIYSADTPTH